MFTFLFMFLLNTHTPMSSVLDGSSWRRKRLKSLVLIDPRQGMAREKEGRLKLFFHWKDKRFKLSCHILSIYCNFYLVCKTNIKTSKIVAELLMSKFKRSTQKSSFMLTENDLGVKVSISSTSYVQFFCTNVVFLVIFLALSKNLYKKRARIMLMKSTEGRHWSACSMLKFHIC